MRLYELLSWVNSRESALTFNHQTITQSAYDLELKWAMDKRRELRADVYTAKFRSSSTPTANDAPQQLEQHDAYIGFLTWCGAELANDQFQGTFFIGLNYLLSTSVDEAQLTKNEEKINTIFFELLKENKEKALDFYHQFQQKFDKFTYVNIMVSAEKSADHLAQLAIQLHGQENALSIAPLFKQFIDDTEKFAAAILWLLRRGETIEQILQADLLQNFMLYHSAWLDSSDSQIKNLYNVLGQFPEAKELVDMAKKVQCEDRGFHCEEWGALLKISSDPESMSFDDIYGLLNRLDGCILYNEKVFYISQRDMSIVAIHPTVEKWGELKTLLNALKFDDLTMASEDGLSVMTSATGRLKDYSYAITGEKCEQRTLHRVLIKPTTPEFTPTAENFHALYGVFGETFLKEALTWGVEAKQVVWHAALRQVLNQEATIAKHLPGLINFVAISSTPRTSETLASLIDDSTIEKLVMQHNGAVLHLLPYKPMLRTQIEEGGITHYLAMMQPADDRVLDTIPQFLSLFFVFRDINQPVAVLVYEAILDLLMQHLQYLDDRLLIKELRKFSEKETILTKRYTHLHHLLDECIEEQVAEGRLSTDNYHVIENMWLSVSRKLDLLNEIMPKASHCPSDKYKLQAYWASMYFARHPGYFILDDFIQALEVTSELFTNRVTVYERVLVELLTTIDNDALRQSIITQFDAMMSEDDHRLMERLKTMDDPDIQQVIQAEIEKNKALSVPWVHKKYSDGCILDIAAKRGNIGLIRWLESRMVLDVEIINQAVILAAEENQWSVVDYFLSSPHHHPTQQVLKELLSLAIAAGELPSVRLLCGGVITHLHEKHLEKAFIEAAAHDHKALVQYLCHLDTGAPNPSMVARAFKVAIHYKSMDVVDFICHSTESTQLQLIVENALLTAATRDDLSMVQKLCSLNTNAPRQTAIEKTFLKAIKYGHLSIAQYLANLSTNAPSQSVINEALDEAIKSKDLRVVRYLFDSGTLPPTQAASNRALQHAVKLKWLDLVEFLCALDKARPRQSAIEQALQSATKSGDLEIVKCLSGFVNHKIMMQTIQLAAKYGQTAIVQYLCELKSPSRKAIFDALRKASPHGHDSIVNYFRCLLDAAPRHSAESDESDVVTPPPVASPSLVEPSPHAESPPVTEPPPHFDSVLPMGPLRVGARRAAPSFHAELLPLDSVDPIKQSSSDGVLGAFGVFSPRGTRFVSFSEPIETLVPTTP